LVHFLRSSNGPTVLEELFTDIKCATDTKKWMIVNEEKRKKKGEKKVKETK
jgi:hypothetical protein